MSSNARDLHPSEVFLLRAGQLSQVDTSVLHVQRPLVHPELSRLMRLADLNVVPVLSALI